MVARGHHDAVDTDVDQAESAVQSHKNREAFTVEGDVYPFLCFAPKRHHRDRSQNSRSQKCVWKNFNPHVVEVCTPRPAVRPTATGEMQTAQTYRTAQAQARRSFAAGTIHIYIA